jgi:hypothetical protein
MTVMCVKQKSHAEIMVEAREAFGMQLSSFSQTARFVLVVIRMSKDLIHGNQEISVLWAHLWGWRKDKEH